MIVLPKMILWGVITVLNPRVKLIITGSVLLLSSVVFAGAIQKCQDEEGNWHYGDFAASECTRSEVTKLSETGTEVGKEGPPPTAEELQQANADKEKKQASAKEKKEQREEDEKLLRVFGSEEVIITTRDRKLESIVNNIDVTRQIRAAILEDIEELKARKQNDKVKKLIEEREQAIQSYDLVIQKSESERAKLEQKYNEILRDFRKATERLASGS